MLYNNINNMKRMINMSTTIYKLSNGLLTLEVSSFGAQIKSLKDKNDKEYIWEADPKIWGNSAPIMFPICGGLKEDTFFHNGKKYNLAKHGFGNSYNYEIAQKSESTLVLKLVSNDETKAVYPFDFEFLVKFELIGETLEITYKTVNTGNEALYHAPGAHEAYALPEGIEEYDVIFDKEEKLSRTVLDGCLLDRKTEFVETDGKTLHMKYSHMDNDCLVFDNALKSDSLNLVNRTTGKGVKVEFSDFPHLVIWTIKKAPYLCIEPWAGLPDFVDSNMVLSEKYSMFKVEPGEEKSFVHKITPIV